MSRKQTDPEEYSFWTRYKHFATTEIFLYLIMIIGITIGLIVLV